MKTECPLWAPPLLALQFLTRLPMPGLARLSQASVEAGLVRAVAWFPLAGALIGSVTAVTVLLAEHVWPRYVAVILALIVEARLTGAFHEDAVADFCDGFGGGRDAQHTRDIMKDSRIGSYGALGLLLAVSLRAALMIALPAAMLMPAVIAASTFGRLLVVSVMGAVPVAPRHHGVSKDIGADLRGCDIGFAAVTAVPGLLAYTMLAPLRLAAAWGIAILFVLAFREWLLRRLGGSTGDCLGFAAYAGQVILLLVAASG